MRILVFVLAAMFGAALCANEIGVAKNQRAWILLGEPLGPGGEGLSPYAGDPGLPSPDWINWPGGNYPATELWCYDNTPGQATRFSFTRVTQLVTNSANLAEGVWRRTLYAPFMVGNEVFVLHFDPSLKHDGTTQCQVVRVSAAKLNEGKKPLISGVTLASADYIDAPTVSPDGQFVAMRAFVKNGSGFDVRLRIYRAADWKLAAESEIGAWGRGAWVDANAFCVVCFDGKDVPRVRDANPAPVKGRLVRLELAEEKLTAINLTDGEFPPDGFTRNVAYDASRKKLALARFDAAKKEIVAEERDARPGATARELARFDHFRGFVIEGSSLYIAGVRDRSADNAARNDRRTIMAVLREKIPGPGDEVVATAGREFSTDGRGGFQDFGGGAGCVIEPVANPLFGQQFQPEILHTMNIIGWPICDTMRNPRALQFLSTIARRFKEIDEFKVVVRGREYSNEIQNTFMAFDLDIKIQDKAIKNKKGRYVEVYDSRGRKKAGRIRVMDNIGGNWMVYAVDGSGSQDGDTVYDNSAVGPQGDLNATPAARSGMYEKLLGQIDSRRLLLLTNVCSAHDKGGLIFKQRDTWRDPVTNISHRIWVYKRKGRAGKQEAAEMGFIADLPASAGNAHPLFVAAVTFGVSNDQVSSSILAFDPTSTVELPDMSGNKSANGETPPAILLPKVVRAYQRNDKGELVEQFSATLLSQLEPEKEAGININRCGYNVGGAGSDATYSKLPMNLKVR